METLAHNNVYSHALDDDVRPNAHDIDGKIDLYDGTHPRIFIEAGGHGVLGASTSHSLYDVASSEFKGGSGVTYVYKGKAERPKHPNDREVGYELLPIWDHWWARSVADDARESGMFDAYYSYRPVGARPVPRYAEIAGSFLGRAQSENKAKPFWGWHDNRTRKDGLLATGQWALDPAYAVQVDLRFPERFSLDYLYNPYLGVGTPSGDAPEVRNVTVLQRGDGVSAPQIGAQFAGDGIQAPQIGGVAAGTLDYEAAVEGEVILSIRGDRVEVVTGAPQAPKASFSQAVPSGNLGRVAVNAKDGRAEVLAQPSASNQYATILRVRPNGNRGKVKFRLEWAR
jgi:hypothetical protein